MYPKGPSASRRDFLLGMALLPGAAAFGACSALSSAQAATSLEKTPLDDSPLPAEVDVADTPLWVRINLAPEGLHPGLMDHSPDGRFFLVPCQDSNNLIVIDVPNLRKTKVIPLEQGTSPWMAKFTPDGKHALVTLSQFVTPEPLVARAQPNPSGTAGRALGGAAGSTGAKPIGSAGNMGTVLGARSIPPGTAGTTPPGAGIGSPDRLDTTSLGVAITSPRQETTPQSATGNVTGGAIGSISGATVGRAQEGPRAGATPNAAGRTATVGVSSGRGQPPNSTVALVDASTWSVVKRIGVGAGPNGVEFLPDGSRAFVANSRSNSVSVIDTSSWSVTKTIPVGAGPFSLCVVPDRGLLVVCNFEGANLSLVDLNTLATTKTIPIGNRILAQPNPEWGRGDTTWFSMGPGGKGYATNWRSNELVVVDLQAGIVVDRIQIGMIHPFEVHHTPGTTYLTLASDIAKRVIMVDPIAKTLVDEFDISGKVFPTGPAADQDRWVNDPDNHSLMLLAPKGLGNIILAGGSSKTL